ncbi:MAG: LuxR C-terminal-related transcriptional regulator [Pseudonocardia sp.]
MDALSRVALMRDRDAGRPWPGQGYGIRPEHAGRVVDLLHVAARSLPEPGPLPVAEIVDHASARGALALLWTATVGALADPAATGAPCATTVELLHEIKRLDEEILLEQVRSRDQALHRLRDALAALRDAESTAAIIDAAASTVCALGFDRAIISRIEESLWIPERVHVDKDPQWAEEILEVGRAHPQPLGGGLIETEMVRRKVSILVDDVQERPSVHRPIAEASMSRSYTAAPIVVRGEVAGFLHADCYHQQRNVDTTDRELLSMFAEGLGQALSRTMVLDRLDALRREIDTIVHTVAAARDHVGWGGGAAAGLPEPRQASGVMHAFLHAAPADPSLTRREVEVLRHMAAGDTNARIARRLVISEGTVKSHVKHILRKLGAANRAEAVSHWLRIAHARRGDGGPR